MNRLLLNPSALFFAFGCLFAQNVAAAEERHSSPLPLFFEANHGQFDSGTSFVARGRNYQFLIGPAGAHIILARPGPSAARGTIRERLIEPRRFTAHAVELRFLGCNPAAGITGMPFRVLSDGTRSALRKGTLWPPPPVLRRSSD